MGNQYQYTGFSKAVPYKFMSTQSVGNILATRPQIVGPNGTEDAVAKRFSVSEMSIQNRSGSTGAFGFGVRIPTDLWVAGQWTDSTTTYAGDTTDAQDAGTSDFALGTTTNEDGFCVFCDVPFNVMSVIVGTATAGGTPAWNDIAYTQAGGTWGSITNPFVAPSFTATGEALVWWAFPQDWAVSEAGHGTGVPTGQYGIRITASTAGSSNGGSATLLVLGHSVYPTSGIADQSIALVTNEGETPLLPQGDALVAICSVANNGHRADGKYRMRA